MPAADDITLAVLKRFDWSIPAVGQRLVALREEAAPIREVLRRLEQKVALAERVFEEISSMTNGNAVEVLAASEAINLHARELSELRSQMHERRSELGPLDAEIESIETCLGQRR